MAANKTTLLGKKQQTHHNHNKCKTIITVPGFILHKSGVCLKAAKKSRLVRWFCTILETILFLAHPFLLFSFFSSSFHFKDTSETSGSGCEEGGRKEIVVPQTVLALLFFQDARTGISPFSCCFQW